MPTIETRSLRNYLPYLNEAACATNNFNQDFKVNISSANKMFCKTLMIIEQLKGCPIFSC